MNIKYRIFKRQAKNANGEVFMWVAFDIMTHPPLIIRHRLLITD